MQNLTVCLLIHSLTIQLFHLWLNRYRKPFLCIVISRFYILMSFLVMFQVDALAAASQCVEMLNRSEGDMLLAITSHVVTLWQRVAFHEILTAEETSVKGSQWLEHFVSVLCSVTAPLSLHMNNSQLIKVCLYHILDRAL